MPHPVIQPDIISTAATMAMGWIRNKMDRSSMQTYAKGDVDGVARGEKIGG